MQGFRVLGDQRGRDELLRRVREDPRLIQGRGSSGSRWLTEEGLSFTAIQHITNYMCVCVCVCVEREREREKRREYKFMANVRTDERPQVKNA